MGHFNFQIFDTDTFNWMIRKASGLYVCHLFLRVLFCDNGRRKQRGNWLAGNNHYHLGSSGGSSFDTVIT